MSGCACNQPQGSWEDDVYHGEGCLYIKLWNVTYEGRFAGGKPSTGPIARKVNASFAIAAAAADPKAKGAKPAAPADTTMQGQAGAPLPYPITIAMQEEGGLEEYSVPATPALSEGGEEAQPPLFTYVLSDEPREGCAWKTASMEHGRRVNVTLHKEPLEPLPEDQACSLLLAVVQQEDGGVAVRISIFQVRPSGRRHRVARCTCCRIDISGQSVGWRDCCFGRSQRLHGTAQSPMHCY